MVGPRSTDRSRRLAALACLYCAGALGYEDGAPPGYTAGFGEPDCTECHTDNELNDAGGRVRIDGLPTEPVAGERYRIQIAVEHDELESAGFQASIRTLDGAPTGTIELISERTAAVEADGQRYVQHSTNGREPDDAHRVDWSFVWIAPPGAPPVVIHVAANASNDDLSALGDYIFTATSRSGEPRE